jgi:predicted nucleic acid-binding protein
VAVLFLDTSALVKLYVDEEGTRQMCELAHPDAGHQLAVVSLARIEFRSAIRRRASQGDIDSVGADAMVRQLDKHLDSLLLVVPLSDTVLDQAAVVVDQYLLRAYDAIQLAAGLHLVSRFPDDEEILFVTADRQLAEAAAGAGLGTIVPTDPVE